MRILVCREVELLADMGAVYTVCLGASWRRLGVRSVGGRRFKPANSQVIERGVWAL